MMKQLLSATLLLLCLSIPASAEILTLNMSGTLQGDTTLGGVTLGSPTAFSFSAVFDSTAKLAGGVYYGRFDATTTWTIDGHGTFASASRATNVFLQNSMDYNNLNGLRAGLSDLGGSNSIIGNYSSPAGWDNDNPTVTTFSGLNVVGSQLFGAYSVAFTNGQSLAVAHSSAPTFASSGSITPEPSTFVSLASLGAIGLYSCGWRRRREPLRR